MSLDLVQKRNDECRIELVCARRNAAGQYHISRFIAAVLQHAVLIVQVIKIDRNGGLFSSVTTCAAIST